MDEIHCVFVYGSAVDFHPFEAILRKAMLHHRHYMLSENGPKRKEGAWSRLCKALGGLFRSKTTQQAEEDASAVDHVLDKISRQGMQSLTADERRLLESHSAAKQEAFRHP